MDFLNRYSKISIVSLLNSANTISATDLSVCTRLGSNVFTFQENGENYSFMVLDFEVNGKRYLLTGNEKLEKLILNNLPEEEIKIIKDEIIAASKEGEDKNFKKKYKKLIDRVKVVKLDSAQVANGNIRYRIKDKDGSYYRYYDDFLKKDNKFYLEDWTNTPLWVEDSYSSKTIYVINSLKIDKKEIDNDLKLCNAVTTYDGSRINSNLFSWCEDRNFESFGQLSTDMDFKKLILSNYKREYKNDNVYEAEKLGYLSETLDYYVTEFKKQLQSFIDNNTEYELSVELMTKDIFDVHYKEHNVSIKLRPNMTYGELLRAVIKKCREIENLSDDSVLIRNNDYLSISGTRYEKFNDFVVLSNNNNKIKLDIKYLKFKYWIDNSGYDRNDDEYIFWKEINKSCKDEEIKQEEDKQGEKQNEKPQEKDKKGEDKQREKQNEKPQGKDKKEEDKQNYVEQQNENPKGKGKKEEDKKEEDKKVGLCNCGSKSQNN